MQTGTIPKIWRPFLRRLLIGAVILPPVIGLSGVGGTKVERLHIFATAHQIIIPGSPSYLDLNPNF